MAVLALIAFTPLTAHAACTMPNAAPDAAAGDIAYNIDLDVMQYCNGTSWISMGGGNSTALPTCANGEIVQYDDPNNEWDCVAMPTAATPSGIAGSVQFSNGTAFASDNANFFWDDTNNRLGIGTNTPGYRLDVNGGQVAVGHAGGSIEIGPGTTSNNYAFIDFVGDSTYTDYALRLIRNNTGANATSQFAHRGTGNFYITTQDAAAMVFQTTAADRLTIAATGLVTASTGFAGPGSGLTSLNATNLASGTVATARLGSGTANNTTYLRGDGTWNTPGTTALTCAGGTNPQVYNSHCYTQFATRADTWSSANQICQAWAGSASAGLVIIDDASEQSFISTNYTEDTSWIGFADDAAYASGSSEGNPRWRDGTTASYTNWNATTNQNGSRDCARMNSDGTWRYEDCTIARSFFCESTTATSSLSAQNMCGQRLNGEVTVTWPGCASSTSVYSCLDGVSSVSGSLTNSDGCGTGY